MEAGRCTVAVGPRGALDRPRGQPPAHPRARASCSASDRARRRSDRAAPDRPGSGSPARPGAGTPRGPGPATSTSRPRSAASTSAACCASSSPWPLRILGAARPDRRLAAAAVPRLPRAWPRCTSLGLPLAWLLLGVLVYPWLLLLGFRFVRRAERNERDFVLLLQVLDEDERAP